MQKIMRFLLMFAFLSVGIYSCSDSVVTNPSISEFSMNAWNYNNNYFLADTLYKRSFTEYFGNRDSLTTYVQDNKIETAVSPMEIWVQCDVTEPNKRICTGAVMLGAMPVAGYDTSVTKPEIVQGQKYFGYFRPLNVQEYVLNVYAGFIGLKTAIPDDYHAGIVYRTANGKQYGKGYSASLSTDTLIIKLFKVSSQTPALAPLAWELQLKNVYRIPYRNISRDSEIRVMYNSQGTQAEYIPGFTTKIITMTGLDKVNNNTLAPPPDGLFDWINYYTIIPNGDDIIFPVLKPFSDGLYSSGVGTQYGFEEIYTQTKTAASQNPKSGMYSITGKAIYY